MGWRKLAVAAGLAVGLTACVSTAPSSAPSAERGPGLVSPASTEAADIAAGGGQVRRAGPRLTITLGRGGTVEFTDYRGRKQQGGNQDWDSVAHIYRGRLGEGRYHLVERAAYGRIHDVLIDAVSGSSWSVPGSAHISPDRDRLLVLPDEIGNRQLQLWLLSGPRPKVELDLVPARPVRFDSWLDNERIALRLPDQGVMKTVWLQRTWGAWEIPLGLK
jgi:hypothetical protein